MKRTPVQASGPLKSQRLLAVVVALGACILAISCSSASNPQHFGAFVVIYHAGGATAGSPPQDDHRYDAGEVVSLLNNTGNLQLAGYAFAGWNTAFDRTGTSHAALSSFVMGASDVDLYPVWIPDNLTFASVGTEIAIEGYTVPPIGSFTIPGGVTKIGDFAFDGAAALTEVVLPISLTKIGIYAFRGCSSLATINIPPSVSEIGAYAFKDCGSLTGITIPSSVTFLGNGAFSGCVGLASISLPYSVRSIGAFTFYGCTSLTTITISVFVTSIGDYAFAYCTSLTSISVPPGVATIGEYAFFSCSGLVVASFPISVVSIGRGVFSGCSDLASVGIFATSPPALPVASGAFLGCSPLLKIWVPAGSGSIYKGSTGWSDYASQIFEL